MQNLSDPAPLRPILTQAQTSLTHRLQARNEFGDIVEVSIPAERDLTVYVDKRELVTLMTLGNGAAMQRQTQCQCHHRVGGIERAIHSSTLTSRIIPASMW